MNIHEYQAKVILRQFGVKTPSGKIAHSPEEAVSVAKSIGGSLWVVKAQIHAGGRGKGGGIRLAHSIQEVEDLTKKFIGMNLVTHQTGPSGKTVQKVLVEEGCDIAKEYYLAVLVDRTTGGITFMVSTEGGVDIEDVARKTPEKVYRVSIDPALGIQSFQIRQLGFALQLRSDRLKKFSKLMFGLYGAFIESDCSLVEINPLVETKEGEILALDAKITFDSNALYRRPHIAEMRDLSEEQETEIEASRYGLSFIKLDGEIGCLVNGAGLAMATMDIIKLYGRDPANFLDVGGDANEERVTAAFKIILKDKNVRGILVNIFGGIMKCDVIAAGIIAASKDIEVKVPLVVRLIGTNVERGRRLLSESGLNIISAEDLSSAAAQVVQAIERV